MSEKQGMNRREFITKGGLAVAGATVAVSGLGSLLTACSPAQPQTNAPVQPEVPQWPWPYTKLDPAKVEERAFQKYAEGG